MPELPEVETTCAGIRPHLQGQVLERVEIRERRLRWPIEIGLEEKLAEQKLQSVERRAKYILLRLETGTLVFHLGMSGSLRILMQPFEAQKHEHVDCVFSNGKILRFCDPRRFGALIWIEQELDSHKLFLHLGPEPLQASFNGDYLYQLSRKRKQAIKQLIMNAEVVVGVGNIYANEALFAAGIYPARPAGSLSKKRMYRLVDEIQAVLHNAIVQGGTTLKDFEGPDGKPGYFAQKLRVYGRKGQACVQCNRPLKELRMNNRSTVFCSNCQK